MTHAPYSETSRQRKYRFPNGFGASVVRDQYTYGGDRGLFELAVLDADGHLTYDTPITSDVIGWLTEQDVQEHLGEIAALTAESIHETREARRREERIAELREELDRLESEEDSRA